MDAHQTELYRRIEAFEIDEPGAAFPFIAKLAKENGWPRDYAKRVIDEYRRFAFLAVAAGHPVSPSDQVDQAWHLHLTYTHSYWERFCPDVLGKPLHHNPSKGGAAEQTKFVEWYNQTLESYQRLLGEEPPTDIWPDALQRFGDDLHFRRANTARNWIVPKGPLKWLAAGTLALLANKQCHTTALAGCGSENGGEVSVGSTTVATAGIPNPIDLPGPQFLGPFVVAFAVTVCIAAIIRWYMRRSTDELSSEALHLDPYEVAYLAGGEEAAINAALASLVSDKMLEVKGDDHRLSKSTLTPVLVHPVEQVVLEAVDPESGASIEELHRDWSPLIEIADRLKSLSLIVSDERDWLGRVLPVLVALVVPLFGAIKILVGLSRDKPVGFLVIGCIVALIVAFAAFARRLLRTWEGDRVLQRMKEEKAHLRDDVEGSRIELVGPALALAMGLFGIGVLEGGPLAELHAALKPRSESGGWADYGGGCGGDGGCGGGCGGCGGCG